MSSIVYNAYEYNNFDSGACEENCGICLEQLKNKEKSPLLAHDLIRSKVVHIFHRDCLVPWLTKTGSDKGKCPFCKKAVHYYPQVSLRKKLARMRDVFFSNGLIGGMAASGVVVSGMIWGQLVGRIQVDVIGAIAKTWARPVLGVFNSVIAGGILRDAKLAIPGILVGAAAAVTPGTGPFFEDALETKISIGLQGAIGGLIVESTAIQAISSLAECDRKAIQKGIYSALAVLPLAFGSEPYPLVQELKTVCLVGAAAAAAFALFNEFIAHPRKRFYYE
ncbi:MAG: RING finger domain-containing protein [Chlamydiota bacterium]